MQFAFEFVFAVLGLAIAYSVLVDHVTTGVLLVGAAAGWFGIIWLALVRA